MRSTGSFAATSLAGAIMALMIATGAAPSSPVGRDVASSYRAAVRAYDRARMWGVIARWWVDPEYVPALHDAGHPLTFEQVSRVHPAGGGE